MEPTMPTYRLQKIVTTVYEIYVDAGDDITDPGDFPLFVWDGQEPDE